MSLTFNEVAEIMKIVDSSSCEELMLEVEGMRLVVRRGGTAGSAPSTGVANPVQHQSGSQAEASAATAPQMASPAPQGTPVQGGEGGYIEKSPMVGTFYRCPAPEEAAFVEVGKTVSVGDPLCMIEVMKLYTTISASAGGVVEAILADDAALVEFDQPLFVIRPA